MCLPETEAAPHLLKAKSSSDTLYSLRLGLIIRLGGLEIHKRPWQRFSKRLSPHTRMLTNCGSRVSVSQLSSPLCTCISIVNSAHKSIDLALRGKLLSSLQRSKKKRKKIIKLRNFANCEIIELGVAVHGGSNTEREASWLIWF